MSGISRYGRAKELRVGGHRFADPESNGLWNLLVDEKVNMVPIRSLDPARARTASTQIRKHYKWTARWHSFM